MLIPPWLLVVQIGRFRLPLPLVLLWPLLFFAAVLMYLLLPLMVLVALPLGLARVLLFLPSRLLDFICAFRGLRVDCRSGPSKVLLEFR